MTTSLGKSFNLCDYEKSVLRNDLLLVKASQSWNLDIPNRDSMNPDYRLITVWAPDWRSVSLVSSDSCSVSHLIEFLPQGDMQS